VPDVYEEDSSTGAELAFHRFHALLLPVSGHAIQSVIYVHHRVPHLVPGEPFTDLATRPSVDPG